MGQHIHLVKFDVTSSDGAGNGFNYEDGTFSPEEVQEIIHAVDPANGGSWTPCAGCSLLRKPPAAPRGNLFRAFSAVAMQERVAGRSDYNPA